VMGGTIAARSPPAPLPQNGLPQPAAQTPVPPPDLVEVIVAGKSWRPGRRIAGGAGPWP
jgi:hypothetical protein